jgi:hypothetical protein
MTLTTHQAGAPAAVSSPHAPENRARAVTHITVCVCTYRRPELLARLLAEIERQRTESRFSFSVVVCDNDALQSGRDVVRAFAARTTIGVTYDIQPERNIALTRNRALSHADGDYIAFIDDDEFPVPEWLLNMLQTCERFQAAGVLGPVRPHFETKPPHWVVRGGFCERPEQPTGTPMAWNKCRTGNLLFRREILRDGNAAFAPEFADGGEDVDFFRRMCALGHRFVWCNEAPAYESVPASRLTRSYMLKRALLRGQNTLKMPGSHAKAIATSLVALPAYAVVLPLAAIGGRHVFMLYCIRSCDHLGRVLTAVGLPPLRERHN